MLHFNSNLKIIVLVSCLWVTIHSANAQTLRAGIDYPTEIEDPQITGINKEPYHATLMPYADLKEALKADRHASSYCRVLNGVWKFNWVSSPEKRPVDFYKADFDVLNGTILPYPQIGKLKAMVHPFTAI